MKFDELVEVYYKEGPISSGVPTIDIHIRRSAGDTIYECTMSKLSKITRELYSNYDIRAVTAVSQDRLKVILFEPESEE